MSDRFDFPGWRFLGAYPHQQSDDVGSWLLHHNGEALLLETPPGLSVDSVRQALEETGSRLAYVTTSHRHEDHFDPETWLNLRKAWRKATYLLPSRHISPSETELFLGGEPLWLLKAAKHSRSDIVTVFRGVAMTGDIELGTLDAVNREVAPKLKAESMAFLRDFPDRTGYGVGTIVSAHLNDLRENVDWKSLFTVA